MTLTEAIAPVAVQKRTPIVLRPPLTGPPVGAIGAPGCAAAALVAAWLAAAAGCRSFGGRPPEVPMTK